MSPSWSRCVLVRALRGGAGCVSAALAMTTVRAAGAGEGPDLGLLRSFLEADAPRVTCPEHGVVVASVPWAGHGSRHTRVFEDTVAWMATRTSKSTLEVLLRIAWRTVGAIVTRVVAEGVAARDLLQGLRRITDR